MQLREVDIMQAEILHMFFEMDWAGVSFCTGLCRCATSTQEYRYDTESCSQGRHCRCSYYIGSPSGVIHGPKVTEPLSFCRAISATISSPAFCKKEFGWYLVTSSQDFSSYYIWYWNSRISLYIIQTCFAAPMAPTFPLISTLFKNPQSLPDRNNATARPLH